MSNEEELEDFDKFLNYYDKHDIDNKIDDITQQICEYMDELLRKAIKGDKEVESMVRQGMVHVILCNLILNDLLHFTKDVKQAYAYSAFQFLLDKYKQNIFEFENMSQVALIELQKKLKLH